MKEITELNLSDDAHYTENHEWARLEGDRVRIGISDYAQDQLGDVVFVELPLVGSTYEQGQEFGTVESVKAVAELYMPIGGEVIATNTVLEDSPDLVNKNPSNDGWMIEVKATNPAELDTLMTKNAYLELLKGLE
ncbi:MAG: glycine cleavage system protein H [Desulfobacteraceae bacterium 4484_190.2]|nr:MAG: glycine cleavage system protein H [Desulfobacteraceae bacterium 4484_190.2]